MLIQWTKIQEYVFDSSCNENDLILRTWATKDMGVTGCAEFWFIY